MAGEWIKMECSTPDKPEVLAITVKMGWDDPDLTVGKLFRVWKWFDQHTTDGNASSVTTALLDRISGVTGFAEAMQSVGWLTVTESGLQLPNFDRHTGETAKSRAQTAKRVAGHRARTCENKGCNAVNVTEALAREEKEKRREEEKKKAKAAQAAKSFKGWTEEHFSAVVKEINSIGILSAQEEILFLEYWAEPTPSGKMRLTTQEAWDTKRRMQTWEKRSNRSGTQYREAGGLVL